MPCRPLADGLVPDTPSPAHHVLAVLHSLRLTPPRLIQSPPTQPRRASVALIIRMRPSSDVVFAGHEPVGWEGEVVPDSQFGLGYGIEDFFRLRGYLCVSLTCHLYFGGENPT